jgi:hypothetical protein
MLMEQESTSSWSLEGRHTEGSDTTGQASVEFDIMDSDEHCAQVSKLENEEHENEVLPPLVPK